MTIWRSVYTILDSIENIGGFVSFFMLLGAFLTGYYQDFVLDQFLISKLFLEEPKVNPKKIKKENDFSIHKVMVKYDHMPEKLVPYFLEVRN